MPNGPWDHRWRLLEGLQAQSTFCLGAWTLIQACMTRLYSKKDVLSSMAKARRFEKRQKRFQGGSKGTVILLLVRHPRYSSMNAPPTSPSSNSNGPQLGVCPPLVGTVHTEPCAGPGSGLPRGEHHARRPDPGPAHGSVCTVPCEGGHTPNWGLLLVLINNLEAPCEAS